ncbi:phosphate ABC transporter substrate-binding protein [Desulfosarcina widdelii]|uniref:Phosphate-binding protein n=1 Tax=Desulfosarcina widdelii TaxID=947919 RepID=A0A5K7Z6N4_9BACT|nr:phosphate ABC transporter substrate-binding protein [Desulfosarcina widdelii]BBO76678.1 phosphate ABC transporter substrate-binding protein [Desulfosarcina widdelii]
MTRIGRSLYGMVAISILTLLLKGVAPAVADDLSPFAGQAGTIKISGGTAHIPVMKAAAKQIMQRFSDVRITIAGGGSGVGIKQVGEGLVDIGNSGRKPTDDEIAKYGLKMFKWAIDGVGLVVNPENPVTSLTTSQVKAIFAGTIDNWKALGGTDKAINLYTRDTASGTRSVFWKKALGKGAISAKANVVVSNGAMKAAVANDPYAIGYVSVGHMDESVQPVALDGVTPTLETVKRGEYKIARGLYSNTKGDPNGLTKTFIDFLFSETGQGLAAAKGFIPVK